MAGHQQESNEARTALVAGSTSRDQQQGHDHDEGWLQLSIGGINNTNINHADTTTSSTTYTTRSFPSTTALVEVDLLNNNMSMLRSTNNTILTQPPFMFPQLRTAEWNAFLLLQQDSINWGYINRHFITPQFPAASLPSSSSPHRIHNHATPNNPGATDHMRVINLPRRINSGIWFMLQASQTQAEPYLPQISKNFLRIKDGRMTVKLLMKYLVNKLRLDSEFEVEIRCRGKDMEVNWTLQHVRDNIWSLPQRVMPPLPYTVNDHLMLLHYGRRSPPP